MGPKGFKFALQSLTNFLIAHQVPATLWLKLPKGDAWWTDVWQYAQQAAGCTVYALGAQTGTPPENLAASLRPIAIEQDDDLKREYMCVAIADNFVVALLAVRTPTGEQPAADKRTISLYCSTSGRSIAALGLGIKQVIENSLGAAASELSAEALQPKGDAQNDFAEDEFMQGKAALSQWERLFPADLLAREALPLTGTFLAWQLQFQEDLRSQLSTYRHADKSDAAEAESSLAPEFLAKARQELHSPLTTIKTALTLLGSPALKLPQRQRYLEMISTQCDHQKSLINGITNLLKIQTTPALDPQPLQLAEIIPGIVSTYQPIAEEHGIMLAYTIPASLSEVLCVESELKEIVIHLINNGIQITPQGGRVWVAATAQDARFIALTVQDSGAGIAKPDTDKLFDPFYRCANNSKQASAGLGLTLVQQLVTRMGGSVAVESVQSQGTTFKILLPMHRSEPSTTATANSSASQTPSSHPSFLVSPAASNSASSLASV